MKDNSWKNNRSSILGGSILGGFTLVELAVVILIIGLITGGVVAGKSFINSAKILSVVSEVGEYKTAVTSFIEKYKSKPGDMSDAYDYFAKGDNSICGNDNSSAIGCNGNDNGLYETYDTSNSESLRAWKHLSLAGFISGSYTGVKYSSSVYAKTNVNVPLSAFDNAGYLFLTTTVIAFPSYTTNGDLLFFGSDNATGTLRGAAIDSVNAQLIDEKLDDGLANIGKVISFNGDAVSGCVFAAPAPNEYNLATNENKCVMLFFLNESKLE